MSESTGGTVVVDARVVDGVAGEGVVEAVAEVGDVAEDVVGPGRGVVGGPGGVVDAGFETDDEEEEEEEEDDEEEEEPVDAVDASMVANQEIGLASGPQAGASPHHQPDT